MDQTIIDFLKEINSITTALDYLRIGVGARMEDASVKLFKILQDQQKEIKNQQQIIADMNRELANLRRERDGGELKNNPG